MGTPGGDDVQGLTLTVCTGLEPLWREAHARVRAAPDGSSEQARWAAALDALVVALQAGEDVASRRCPHLGRRRWAQRTPHAVEVVPAPAAPGAGAGPRLSARHLRRVAARH
ncbi:hypothetical protein [Thalassiella azotivora]